MKRYALLILTAAIAAAGEVDMETDSPVGVRLPELRDKALDGIMVVLPDFAEGHVALVGLGFRRESQEPLESWMKPFVREFPDSMGYRHYEVPMMGRGLVKLFGGMINRGMRVGTPQTEHRFVVPFYGDTRKYARMLKLDTEDEHVFLFLLDREGTIRWFGEGWADDDGLASLFGKARELAGVD